jgi:hypothetical protein
MDSIWDYINEIDESTDEKESKKKYELIKKKTSAKAKPMPKTKNEERAENIKECLEVTKGSNGNYIIDMKYLDMFYNKYFTSNEQKYIKSLDFKNSLEFYIEYKNIPTEIKYKHIKKIINPNSFEKYVINFHSGQKKLYLSEMYFLTKIIDKGLVRPNTIVIYVGAGPGHHLIKLISLFPQFTYHLYDNVFDSELQKIPNVKLFLRFFTAEDCAFYKDKNVIFISDIRNPIIGNIDTRNEDKNVKEQNTIIISDQSLQEIWVRTISPYASSLKFRLPWVKNQMEYKYLDGEIFLQPYKPKNSSESRLFVYDSKSTKSYDCIEYDSKMFFSNRILRHLYGHFNKFSFDYDYMLYIYNYYKKVVNKDIIDLDYKNKN